MSKFTIRDAWYNDNKVRNDLQLTVALAGALYEAMPPEERAYVASLAGSNYTLTECMEGMARYLRTAKAINLLALMFDIKAIYVLAALITLAAEKAGSNV